MPTPRSSLLAGLLLAACGTVADNPQMMSSTTGPSTATDSSGSSTSTGDTTSTTSGPDDTTTSDGDDDPSLPTTITDADESESSSASSSSGTTGPDPDACDGYWACLEAGGTPEQCSNLPGVDVQFCEELQCMIWEEDCLDREVEACELWLANCQPEGTTSTDTGGSTGGTSSDTGGSTDTGG
ncbi:MAG TPA: hypothetical protein VFG69_14600 [Nannocystaceae bacterium]|nr:hypothetical protein [Nannocystaceae bacterium]